MNQAIKRGLLGLAFVGVFGLSYGVSVMAGPYLGTMFGRETWVGYFTGWLDDEGGKVLPADYDGGVNAIPSSTDTPEELYNFIVRHNYNGENMGYGLGGTDERRRRGAAFIVNTMLGRNAPGNYLLTDQDKSDWYKLILTAGAHGRIVWHFNYRFNINSYYQGLPDGSNPYDDAWYAENLQRDSMLFYNQNGQLWYAIKWDCGNPVVFNALPGPTPAWESHGRTSISDGVPNAGDTSTNITTRPGDILRWTHNIQNLGPGSNPGHSWRVYGQTSTQPWTASYYNNISLSGAPVLTRQENNIFYSGDSSPAPGVNADGFSVRWTKTENLPAGTYQFSVTSDDGVRVLVDGAYVINDWTTHWNVPFNGTVNLAAGNHTITIEWFEVGGPGYLSVMPYMYLVRDWVVEGGFAVGEDRMVNNTETYTVPASAAPGTKICRNLIWFWKNSWLAGDPWAPVGYPQSGVGEMACATVASTYNLTPTVLPPSPSYVQPGDNITFRYRIANSGAVSPSATCTVRDGGGSVVTVPGSTCAAGQVFSANSTLIVATENVSIPSNATPGTQICRTLTIAPATSSLASRTSPQVCVVVAKRPYVHFTGGDVWAGGGFTAVAPGTCDISAKITTVTRSQAVADGTWPGSGTSYAAFALNRITDFGSASVSRVTSTGSGDNWTFSNINASDLGFFGAAQHCLNDYAAEYSTLPISAPPGINNPVSGAWHVTGPINLAGTMPLGDLPGGRKVYFVDGDVNINGNISYPASYASAAQIPSLVIIATGNIRVLNIVNRADGIFIARGTFLTCHPKIEPATTSTCNVPLTINGAVTATNLDLFRTAGADGAVPATQKAAAEVFNLSSEVFIANALNQTTQTTITTSNVRELPPRF